MSRRVLQLALVVGLVLRLAILLGTRGLETKIFDEHDYTRLATSILERHEFAFGPGELTSLRPPLYPAFVAAIWSVTGNGNLQAIRLAQIVLALLTMGLVYQLGRRAFNVEVGRYAAAVFWLYPSLIFFNYMILTEGLFTMLLVAFVLLSVMMVQHPRAGTALVCGATLGLAALSEERARGRCLSCSVPCSSSCSARRRGRRSCSRPSCSRAMWRSSRLGPCATLRLPGCRGDRRHDGVASICEWATTSTRRTTACGTP